MAKEDGSKASTGPIGGTGWRIGLIECPFVNRFVYAYIYHMRICKTLRWHPNQVSNLFLVARRMSPDSLGSFTARASTIGAVKRHGLTLTKDANGAYHAA
jgi:hypothetical protein